MSLILAVPLMLVPPPSDLGDQRTEILASIHSLVDALATGDHEAVDALLESDGTMVRVDVRDPANLGQQVIPFAELRKPTIRDIPPMVETLGIPTLFQRGAIAQVWVPYRFSISGTLSHCGIDSFTLVRRGDRWRTASLVYTVENTDQCKAVAAPETDR